MRKKHTCKYKINKHLQCKKSIEEYKSQRKNTCKYKINQNSEQKNS